MADFNPTIPFTTPPNFERSTRPIEQPMADKSTGIALATTADSLVDATNLAKQTAEQYIKEDVKSRMQPLQDSFITALENQRNNNTIPQASSSLNFDQTPTQDIPVGVQKGVQRISNLNDAMAGASTSYNDTWLHGQMYKEAQSLRAKYPGFTDYVDQEISKITGVKPANAYIADMLSDLNKAQSGKKTEYDKTVDAVRKGAIEGYDKGPQMLERIQADPSFAPKAYQWLNEEAKKKRDLEVQDLQLKNYAGNKQYQGGLQLQAAQKTIASMVDSDLNATIKLTGMDKPEPIRQILQEASDNPNRYKPDQLQELATRFNSQGALMESQIRSRLVANPNFSDMDQSAMEDAIKNGTKVYGLANQALVGGGSTGVGIAFHLLNQTHALYQTRDYNIKSTPEGAYLDNWKIISDNLGNAGSAAFVADINKKGGLTDRLRPLLETNRAEALAQPGGTTKPTTIVKHIQDIKNNDKLTPQDKQQLIQGVVGTVDYLKNPAIDPTSKANAVQYLFGPSSNGLLGNFKMDYMDKTPDGRAYRVHPGKHAVMDQLTDPGVTDAISKLDNTSKQTYKTSVDLLGRELIGQDVRDLNRYSGNANLSFQWDGKTKQIILKDSESNMNNPTNQIQSRYFGPDQRFEEGYRAQAQATVDRINRILPNLDRVNKTFGGDTETMLLQTLGQYGMNNEGKITGLPKSLGDAIAAARKPQPKPAAE